MFDTEYHHDCGHDHSHSVQPKHLQSAHFVEAGRLILRGGQINPNEAGTLRTPERFGKALQQLLSGYETKVSDVIGEGVFPSESNGLVSVRDIEFYSMCEHHMLPFWGKVSVAYYPGEKIVGLSKIPRLVNLFARRLQVQERLTQQVADALNEALKPRAIVVRATAQHLCMMMRGVEKQMSETLTETHVHLEALTELERQRIFQSIV